MPVKNSTPKELEKLEDNLDDSRAETQTLPKGSESVLAEWDNDKDADYDSLT